MFDFDVEFFDADGGFNRAIVSANYIGEAAEYIESVKGGRVFKISCKDISAMLLSWQEELKKTSLTKMNLYGGGSGGRG